MVPVFSINSKPYATRRSSSSLFFGALCTQGPTTHSLRPVGAAWSAWTSGPSGRAALQTVARSCHHSHTYTHTCAVPPLSKLVVLRVRGHVLVLFLLFLVLLAIALLHHLQVPLQPESFGDCVARRLLRLLVVAVVQPAAGVGVLQQRRDGLSSSSGSEPSLSGGSDAFRSSRVRLPFRVARAARLRLGVSVVLGFDSGSTKPSTG